MLFLYAQVLYGRYVVLLLNSSNFKRIYLATLILSVCVFSTQAQATVNGYGALTSNAIETLSTELAEYEPSVSTYLYDNETLILQGEQMDTSIDIKDGSPTPQTVITLTPTNTGGDLTIVGTTTGFGPFTSNSTLTLTPYLADGSITQTTGTTGVDVTPDQGQTVAIWTCASTGMETEFEYSPNPTSIAEAVNGVFIMAGGLWSGCVNS